MLFKWGVTGDFASPWRRNIHELWRQAVWNVSGCASCLWRHCHIARYFRFPERERCPDCSSNGHHRKTHFGPSQRRGDHASLASGCCAGVSAGRIRTLRDPSTTQPWSRSRYEGRGSRRASCLAGRPHSSGGLLREACKGFGTGSLNGKFLGRRWAVIRSSVPRRIDGWALRVFRQSPSPNRKRAKPKRLQVRVSIRSWPGIAPI
jgi:hypothetical protein